MALGVKNMPISAGDVRDLGSIPGLGRSPARGHGNPLQYLAWRIPWPCLFNLYAEHIMGNAGLEEAQAGIKIAGRWYGEGGGRRVQDGEHMYTCGRFILIYGKTNTIL